MIWLHCWVALLSAMLPLLTLVYIAGFWMLSFSQVLLFFCFCQFVFLIGAFLNSCISVSVSFNFLVIYLLCLSFLFIACL